MNNRLETAALHWHESIWKKWLALLQKSKFPHAILLSGLPGLGQSALMMALAKQLNCSAQKETPCGECDACRQIDAKVYPDLFVLQPTDKKNILIEQVRGFCEQITLTHSGRGYKVGLISQAHMMTNNAANSLLKTLEEPPSKTVIILETSEPKRLPVTILSRCQNFALSTPSLEEGMQYITQNIRIDEVLAQQSLHLNLNSPEAALNSLETGENDKQLAFVNKLAKLATKQDNEISVKKEFIEMGLPVLSAWALKWLADVLRIKSGAQNDVLNYPQLHKDLLSWAQEIEVNKLNSLYDDWINLAKTSHHPLNVNLTLERLYIQLITS